MPLKTTNTVEINKQQKGVNTCVGRTCHSNQWQVVPKQLFASYNSLLISSALVAIQSHGLSLNNGCGSG